MISIGKAREIGDAIVASSEILESHLIVSSEAEFGKLMETVVGYPLLLSLIPSARGSEQSADNFEDSNEVAYFVLHPMLNEDSYERGLEIWDLTQRGMIDLREFIQLQITDQSQPYFELLENADYRRRGINPEYNIFGLNGWSLSFSFPSE